MKRDISQGEELFFEHKDFGVLRVIVWPDGEVGFDLADAAKHLGITEEEALNLIEECDLL